MKTMVLLILMATPVFAEGSKSILVSKVFEKDECLVACQEQGKDFEFTIYKKTDLVKKGVSLSQGEKDESCRADVVKKLGLEACVPCFFMCNPAK